MNITDVRVRKIASTGKLRAYVSITFDDEFVVHDIRIIEGDKGLFVAMPSKHMIEGGFKEYCTSNQSECKGESSKCSFESIL